MAEPATGKLAFLDSPKDVKIQEYEVPKPEDGAVLTETIRANVCGSELHIWSGDHPLIKEGVLGHEAICRVTELGDGVETDYAGTPIEVGDLVVPTYFVTCGKCTFCGAGEFRLCENAYQNWSQPPENAPHFHGTFATHYYIHPNQYFYRVPEGLSEDIAASANCALSQVLCGIDKVNVALDDTVVIQGAGGLGLNAAAVANERGATTIVIDGVSGRLEQAKKFGADFLIDLQEDDTVEKRANRVRELTDGHGADVAIEVTGVPSAFSEGIDLLRPGGRYLEMGNIIPGKETSFDPGKLTRKSIKIISLMRYDPWYLQEALQFLERHENDYPFDGLLDSEFTLQNVDDALQQTEERNLTRASLVFE